MSIMNSKPNNLYQMSDLWSYWIQMNNNLKAKIEISLKKILRIIQYIVKIKIIQKSIKSQIKQNKINTMIIVK